MSSCEHEAPQEFSFTMIAETAGTISCCCSTAERALGSLCKCDIEVKQLDGDKKVRPLESSAVKLLICEERLLLTSELIGLPHYLEIQLIILHATSRNL